MNLNNKNKSGFRRVRCGQRGQALVMVPLMLVALIGMGALVLDLGNVYVGYQELQQATQAAALAGGQAIPAGTAIAVATQYSAVASNSNAHPGNLAGVAMTSGYPMLRCLSSTGYGLPSCSVYGGQASANAIVVREQATVKTFFAKIFGVNSVPIGATATASAKGGVVGPYNVMMVLDTTASMQSTLDAGCTVPGVSGSPTAEQCAQYGIQQLLSQLDPCPTNFASCSSSTTPVDEVGLMVFPGLTPGSTTTLSNPPVPGAGASDDYNCSGKSPSTVAYNQNPAYLILPLQYNYRVSDVTTNPLTATLNPSATIVKSVGGTSGCPGTAAPGGQGTFYAGAIYAAQSYLVSAARSNVKNVMILLSDGNAEASTSEMAGSATKYPATNQCQQAIAAANAAKTAVPPTLVYSVSYGSENSGCSTDTSYTPCMTMAGIASSPSTEYLFSVPNTGKSGGTVCNPSNDGGYTPRPVTSLNDVFSAIVDDLGTSRLIPNGTT